jgi:hypothetical protein
MRVIGKTKVIAMNRRNCGLVLIAVLTIACVAGGVCYATTVKGHISVLLPGVNSSGKLDINLGASVPMNFVINTGTGQFTATGKGQVTNQSGKTQTFKNPEISIPPIEGHSIDVTTSTYSVKKTGACTANAHGQAL